MRSGQIVGVHKSSSLAYDNKSQIPYNELNKGEGNEILCTFDTVSVKFTSRSGMHVQALDSISFEINKGEVLGIIGATGSGKSTIAKVLTGLVQPGRGQVKYAGRPLDFGRYPALRKRIQMVFQDPYSALYPHLTVGSYLREAIRLHHIADKGSEDSLIAGKLEEVGLSAEFAGRYPRELSGGERQRVQIARAVLIHPEMIICDEITSGLDQDVQEQVIDLLLKLQQVHQISLVIISHNLNVIRRIADTVIVVDQGKIMRSGTAAAVFGAMG